MELFCALLGRSLAEIEDTARNLMLGRRKFVRDAMHWTVLFLRYPSSRDVPPIFIDLFLSVTRQSAVPARPFFFFFFFPPDSRR